MRMDGVTRAGLVRMMPRLRAEEAVQVANAVFVGRGPQSKQARSGWSRAVAQLEHAARGTRPRRIATRDDFVASMQRLGLNVIVNEKPGGES